MKEALQRLKAESQPVHYMDVSDYTELYAFYRDVLEAMPKGVMDICMDVLKQARSLPTAMMDWLKSHVDKVSGLGVEIDLNAPENQQQLVRYWESVSKALLQALGNTPPKDIPVFAIDELPFMLENLFNNGASGHEITVALASLRKLRDAGLRMVIGGSISLENLLTLHKIPHTVLGGLRREGLPPFTRDEARDFLQARLSGHTGASAIDAVLNKIPDFVPFFLNEAVSYLKVLDANGDVELTMDNQVLPAIRRSFLQQFQERLDKNYLSEELETAQAILDHLARQPSTGATVNLAALPTHSPRVLAKLQYDMFIEEAPGLGFRFTLQLLRLWWQSQRGLMA
jgi:hypothetical protein